MFTKRLSPLTLIVGTSCLLIQTFAFSVHAEESSMKAPLDPQKSTQVREVGHALLQANRHYQADSNAQQIYQQVEQVRSAIESLTRPLPASTLTLANHTATQNVSLQSKFSVTSSSANQWGLARETQINQLTNRLGTLRQYCGDFRNKHEANTPGLFQRFSAWVSGAETNNELSENQVITDVSTQVLDRLERLDEEVNAAINSSPDERHQKLVALAQSLEISQRPVGLPEDERADTPTYITRTTHR